MTKKFSQIFIKVDGEVKKVVALMHTKHLPFELNDYYQSRINDGTIQVDELH